jgi:hypothetical protein
MIAYVSIEPALLLENIWLGSAWSGQCLIDSKAFWVEKKHLTSANVSVFVIFSLCTSVWVEISPDKPANLSAQISDILSASAHCICSFLMHLLCIFCYLDSWSDHWAKNSNFAAAASRSFLHTKDAVQSNAIRIETTALGQIVVQRQFHLSILEAEKRTWVLCSPIHSRPVAIKVN